MSREVLRRHGTTADHAEFTGGLNELTVDSDKKTVVVHDGATVGGFPLARADGVDSDLVASVNVRRILVLWQVEYDALSVIDPDTLYIVVPPILDARNPGQLIFDTSLTSADFTLI